MWVILCLFSTSRVSDPGRRSQTHKANGNLYPRRLRIADQCLIADLEAFIVIYLNDCYRDSSPPGHPQLTNPNALIGRRTHVAATANQLADSFLNLFSANAQGRMVVEPVFLAQLFQIVTFFAFFL
jgi:hypothetical protein